MTETQILRFIKVNLAEPIREAIVGTIYTDDWLGAMAMRETGFLIARYINQGKEPSTIWALMKGDYSQRRNDPKPIYHGFGIWQIDIASYPDYVKSGEWKDPFKCAKKAVSVLEEKREYLQEHFDFTDEEQLHRAITAAYNCGQGNVLKLLKAKKDIDSYTHQKNYSKEVWRFREIYRNII